QFPQAVPASLVLVDAAGPSSSAVSAGVGAGDAGGPSITSAAFNAGTGVLTLKGKGFIGTGLQVVIDGQVVAPPQKAKQKAAKLKITGTASELHLETGFNNIRVTVAGLRSNLFVFSH
ncbi:MAG TPA: hypothetical protein VLZ81_02115, partial [Blastocatellia bacterium]|nr:hypothetical protein [Blastocatellia bacterium]